MKNNTKKWSIIALRAICILPLWAIAVAGEWAEDTADWLDDKLPKVPKD